MPYQSMYLLVLICCHTYKLSFVKYMSAEVVTVLLEVLQLRCIWLVYMIFHDVNPWLIFMH